MPQVVQVTEDPEFDATLASASLDFASSAITKREQAEGQRRFEYFGYAISAKYFRDLLLKPIFDRAEVKLRDMAKLRPNWNSYGAEVPSKESTHVAAEILIALQRLAVAPTKLVPSSEGGVAICFIKGDRYADIECLNTGEILAVTYIGTAEPQVWEIRDGRFEQAIERIREHITA